MIDFATIESALLALVSTLSSDTPAARIPSRMADSPEEQLSDVVRAEITIARGVFVTVGATDERRATYDEGTDDMGDTICSLRRGTWQIKCLSLEQIGSENAWHVVERLRTRLSRRGAREALRAVGVGIIEALPTIDLSNPRDTRQASIAAFDLRVHVAANEADPARYPYIETVGLGGKLDDKTLSPITITGEVQT